MWSAWPLTVKKLDSLPTDALGGRAPGSRDLEVPLKGCVHTFSRVGLENSHSANLPPPPSRGTVSSPGFPLHPASKEHTAQASRGTLIVLGPFYFRDLDVLFGGPHSLSCSGRSSQLHGTGQGMALNSCYD